MVIWNKYKGLDWFESANTYCFHRFVIIEGRFDVASRYVGIHTNNRGTFSYEFASILRDCGSVFGSTMDALVKGSGAITKKQSNIHDYRNFLLSLIPDIENKSIQIRPCFPNGIILPFKEFGKKNGIPAWWKGYNEVKHNEHDKFSGGNLENCVTALSALALLGLWGSWFRSDDLFVNVGMPFDVNKARGQKLLFP